VPERHLGPVEVKEVHELGGLAAAQRVVVDPLGLVVELELDGQDLDALCERVARIRDRARVKPRRRKRDGRTVEGLL